MNFPRVGYIHQPHSTAYPGSIKAQQNRSHRAPSRKQMVVGNVHRENKLFVIEMRECGQANSR